jgi:hypothetical protein
MIEKFLGFLTAERDVDIVAIVYLKIVNYVNKDSPILLSNIAALYLSWKDIL